MLDRRPLPYHRMLRDFVVEQLPDIWAHYGSEPCLADQEEAERTHLKRTTQRLPCDTHADLYGMVDEVASALDLAVPVELYQAQDDGRWNARLHFHPDATRLSFHGPILERLTPAELRAVVAHALGHHHLWTAADGAYLQLARVLDAMARIEDPPAVESARLFRLHTAIHCDRMALTVVAPEVAVAALVKVQTQASRVDGEAFLQQSRALLAAVGTGSRDWSHPEARIRALALTAEVLDLRALVEGPIELRALDLLRQAQLHTTTRSLIGHLLSPSWFQTDTTIGHTREMFDDELPRFHPWWGSPAELLVPWGPTVREYLVALLVDYVEVDPDLSTLPLLRAHRVAESLGLHQDLEQALMTYLKRPRRDLAATLSDRDEVLDAAAEAADG